MISDSQISGGTKMRHQGAASNRILLPKLVLAWVARFQAKFLNASATSRAVGHGKGMELFHVDPSIHVISLHRRGIGPARSADAVWS
jgi:hypothetical protein